MVGLDLEEWRREQSLTYDQLAGTLKCSLSNARRWALGEAVPDGEALHRILDASAGRVGLYALHRRRIAYLRNRGHWSIERARASIEHLRNPAAA